MLLDVVKAEKLFYVRKTSGRSVFSNLDQSQTDPFRSVLPVNLVELLRPGDGFLGASPSPSRYFGA